MSDTQTPRVSRTGMKPWLKVLLAVSLTANLAVAGVVIGAVIGHDRDDRHPQRPETRERFDPAMGPFSRALPEPYRTQAFDELRARGGDYKQDRSEIAVQLTQMIGILRADPFDSEELKTVLIEQSDLFTRRTELGRDVVLEQIEAMSPEEREELADRLEGGFRRALDKARTKPDDR